MVSPAIKYYTFARDNLVHLLLAFVHPYEFWERGLSLMQKTGQVEKV